MAKIKFNDLKTIGYSFKVYTNKKEKKYITYTVIDYNEDAKDATGVSCVQIILVHPTFRVIRQSCSA